MKILLPFVLQLTAQEVEKSDSISIKLDQLSLETAPVLFEKLKMEKLAEKQGDNLPTLQKRDQNRLEPIKEEDEQKKKTKAGITTPEDPQIVFDQGDFKHLKSGGPTVRPLQLTSDDKPDQLESLSDSKKETPKG